jgi:hypothetical protein
MNTTTAVISHLFMAAGILITLKLAYDKLIPLAKRLLPKPSANKHDAINSLQDSHDRSHRLVVNELNHIKGQLQDIGQKVQAKQQDNSNAIYIQALSSLAQASNAIIERQERIENLLTKLLTNE